MTYAEQREKEIQKYRDILKYRDLTPEENERFGKLVTEKLDEKQPSIEEYKSLLQNIKETGICAVYIDSPAYGMPPGTRPYTQNEFMTMLERKCQHNKKTNSQKSE